MYNQKEILNIYNSICDKKLNQEELLPILPKLYLLINKINMDNIELIKVIDVLEEIKDKGYISKITPEIVDFIIKTTKNDFIDLSGTLYFSIILKHVILPFNENTCVEDYNLIMYCSEFENLLIQMGKMLNKNDLFILDKYNHELKELLLSFCKAMNIYNKKVSNDVILNSMICHFGSILYFNLDKFDYQYDLIPEIVDNIIANQETYMQFLNYCFSFDIHKNYTRIPDNLVGIELEYDVSKKMLDYLFEGKKNKKIKRKEK